MKKKELKHGERFSYYLKKSEFPQELLDWLNSQSDRNLVFTYALEQLYNTIGNQDLASLLPRDYVPLKERENPISIPTKNEIASSISEPVNNTKNKIKDEENYNFLNTTSTDSEIDEKSNKNNTEKWGKIDLTGDPYA